jgi:hypothetical protein
VHKLLLQISVTIILFTAVSDAVYSQYSQNRHVFGNPLPDHSQMEKFQCGTTGRDAITGLIPTVTPLPGQFLRILIIYVKFPDDDLFGDPMNGYAVWHDPNMPGPKNVYTSDNKFIDSAEQDSGIPFMQRYREYTISDYFSEMSMGSLDVVGDEYFITLPSTSAEYRKLGHAFSQINAEAITLADSIYNIDFTRYNNWTLSGGQWQWLPGSGDNSADMIVMVYRRAPGFPQDPWFINVGVPVSGIADLGLATPLEFDSTNIFGSSGVTCMSLMQNYSRMTQIMLHEVCHRYFFNHVSIGLMTGAEHSSFSMSPRERWNMGYITPDTVGFPYTENSHIYTLGDYISTGDMVSIELPGTNQRFLLANHQKRSVYDGISRGGKMCWKYNRAQQDPYCPDGHGLYFYHEMPVAACSNLKEVELEQAEGRYNWYIDRWVQYFDPAYDFQIPLFKELKGNILGRGEYHEIIDTAIGSQQELTDNYCRDDSAYYVTIDWLGDGRDAFNMGYDEVFSPYSNPATNLCNGTASGISFKLLNKDLFTGAITFKVYYNDALALQEMPPAKPKNLKVEKEIFEPGTGRFHPRLSWDKNREPDFENGSINPNALYNVYRSVELNCSEERDPVFIFIANVSPDSTAYTDQSISLYPYGGGQIHCNDQFRSVSYKIEAVDNSLLNSLRSERALINGYENRCDDSALVGITSNQTPLKFSVFNYPNPFNPSTAIKFALPKNAFVTIRIYNLLGEEIAALLKNKFYTAGNHSAMFDGTNLPSGVYFYRIEAGIYVESKKMVLVK